MKIWCCLCFTQEDEPEEEDSEGEPIMKEGNFENEGNAEGVTGNGEEAEGNVPRLGLASIDPGRDGNGHLRMFEGMVQAMRGGAQWDESVCVGALATLRAAIRSPRLSEGESSSASAADDGDHDSHHKRAKVHSFSHDVHCAMVISSGAGNSSSSADRDYRIKGMI